MTNKDQSTMIMDLFNAPHFRLNKNIVRVYGVDTAMWIADIFSRWSYFREKHRLVDGYFFCTQKELRASTLLNFNKLTHISKLLKEDGVISIKRIGIPPKNWYKVNVIRLSEKIYESNSKNTNPDLCYVNDDICNSFMEEWNTHSLAFEPEELNQTTKAAINKVVSSGDYSDDEIFEAFSNYASILASDEHMLTHIWSLSSFLNKALFKFVPAADPDNTYSVHNRDRKKKEDI